MPKASLVPTEAEQWITTIAVYDREFKRWEGRVEKILKRYRDEQRTLGVGAKFNILWANVQTAIPAVFSRLPKPDVSRRHRDNDPVGRVAALLLERALEFEVDHYPDYRAAMKNSVQDRFLGGRGVAWVRYEPHIKQVADDGDQVTEDADEAEPTESTEEIEFESSPTDYVHWKDFGHTVARTWEEVTGVWRKVYMGRNALVERFGAEGEKIPLDTKPTEKRDMGGDTKYEALIYEIWDKTSGKALWLSKSLGKIVDSKPDPLGLENFWPCPRPLFATLTTCSLVPVPDFTLYQDQAETLDILADRIDGLIKALKVRGVYDGSIPELGRLFTEGNNNDLIAVKNWLAFAEKQGLAGALDLVDLTPIFNALKVCYEAVEQQKNQVWEITGLADIIRGSTDPNETATAQKMKGQFGSMRLRAMQNDVSQYAAELLQIKAQIIAKHYQPDTLKAIGAANVLQEEDRQYIDPAIQLLKDSPLRDFRIEVTADSMIQMDEAQEKQDRMEFLKATSDFLKEAVPAGAASPQLAPLLLDMLKYAVTAFKVGKQIEGAFDATADALKKAAANPQPKPDPEMAKIQATSQADAQRLQAEGQQKQAELAMQDQQHQRELQAKQQYDQFKANLDAQVERDKQQAQAQETQATNVMEAQREQARAQLEAQTAQHQAGLDAQQQLAELDFKRFDAELKARTAVTVAEISAGATLQAAQLAAATAESEGKRMLEQKDKESERAAKEPKEKSQPVTIHNHIPPAGNKKIKKTPDGYESEDA